MLVVCQFHQVSLRQQILKQNHTQNTQLHTTGINNTGLVSSMQKGSYLPNPYARGAPFNNGDTGFRSPFPPPQYQSSPRFHQQYVPHHNMQHHNMQPSGAHSPSPRRMKSPYTSPNASHGSGHSSGSANWNTPSDRGRGTPRGRFTPNSSNSPNFYAKFSSPRFETNSNPGSCNKSYSQKFTSPRNDSNYNPGRSNSIEVYYNQNMVSDPWANLRPVPVTKSSTPST